jgi:hypothetical protein
MLSVIEGAGSSTSKCRFIKKIAKLLSALIRCRCTYVDKHPVLLERIHSLIEQLREDVSFQAGWLFRDVLQNRMVKDVNAAIHQSGYIAGRLFRKASHSAGRIHV